MYTIVRFMRTHRLLSVLAVTVLVAGSYVGYTQAFGAKAPDQPIQTATVELGNLRLAVSASGSVVAPRAVDLAFKQSGVVEEVYVEVGQSVTAGQPLAKLESRTLEFQVRQAEIALRTAQLTLDALITGSRPEDVAAANAAVESARAKLENMEAQGDTGDIAAAEASLGSARAKLNVLTNPTEADLASARAAVETAAANLRSAQAKLDQLRQPTASDIRTAENALAAAQAKLLALRNPTGGEVAASRASIASAEASLGKARTSLDQLRNPTAEKLAEAEASVVSAQRGLREAERARADLRIGLDEAKIKELLEAYFDVQGLRERLLVERAQGVPPEVVGKTVLELQAAIERYRTAEEESRSAKVGVSVEQLLASDASLDAAKSSLASAQTKLDRLLHPPLADVVAAENEVASSEASLQSARAKLEQLTNPSEADVTAAQSAVVKAQAELEKLRNPQPADLASAEASVASSQASLSSAQAKLAQLLNPSPADLAAAQSAVAQAENQLDQTRTPYKAADLTAQRAALQQAMASLNKTSAPSTVQDLAKAELNVDRAQLDLDQAQYSLDQATLKAPFNGIVGKVSIVPGGLQSGAGGSSSGGAGGGPISVIDPNGMQALVSVDETDVARLQLGQTAEVAVEAAGARPYEGRIVAISPSGTVQSGVTTYQVLLALGAPRGRVESGEPAGGARATGASQQRGQAGGQTGQQRARPSGQRPSGDAPGGELAQLKAGMTAVATIVYAERQEVLLVPNRAIKRSGQQRTVEVQVDGKAENRNVTVGLTDDQRTEIREGLAAGEVVLLPAATTGQQQGQRTQVGFGPTGGFGGPGAGFRPIGR